VRQLQEELGAGTELFLILGADSVREIPIWWRAAELVREVGVIAVGRPGYSLEEDVKELADRFGRAWAGRVEKLKVDAPMMEISATRIRSRLRAGQSVRYMVPGRVLDYIRREGLYGAAGG
jgi:nicotinate-nucleotide adenylyltransferase